MAIYNYDDIIANRAAGRGDDVLWYKTKSITPAAVGNWVSLINSAGYPAARTASGGNNGAIMTNLNTGAIPISSPGADYEKYLLTVGAHVPARTGFDGLLLIDVVWLANYACSSSPGNITTPTFTRWTDGKGLRIGCAVTVTFGSFTPTITVTYTDPVNGAGRSASTGAFASALAAPKMMPLLMPNLPLQSGDTGVTAITNITASATNATGSYDIFVYKPLAYLPMVAANMPIERDQTIQIDSFKLPKDASNNTSCLCWLARAEGKSACATQGGMIRTVKG